MNAYARSAQSMASTIANIGRQRPHLDLRILTSEYGGPLGPHFLVAVGDKYFRVREMTLQQLRLGIPPEEMDLDEVDPDEDREED